MSGKKDAPGLTAASGAPGETSGHLAPQGHGAPMVSEEKRLVRNERPREINMRCGPPSQRPAKGAGMIDRSLQERIGAVLRESFADIEKEPLPERLSKLIEALHREEKRR